VMFFLYLWGLWGGNCLQGLTLSLVRRRTYS